MLRICLSMPSTAPFYYNLPDDGNPVVRIGRNEDNDICLPLNSISDFHAILQRINGQWTLSDVGSTNGIRSMVPPNEWGYPLSVGVPFGLGDVTLMLEEEPDDLVIPLGELERPHLGGTPDVKSLSYREEQSFVEEVTPIMKRSASPTKQWIITLWLLIVCLSVMTIVYLWWF